MKLFNDMDANLRSDLRELNGINFDRFDDRLHQRLAESDTRLETRLSETDAKWEIRFSQTEAKMADLRAELIQVDVHLLGRLHVHHPGSRHRHSAIRMNPLP